MDDDSVTIRLYNVTGFENLSTAALESKLCSSIESSTEQNTVTLTFHLNEGVRLLGWDVRFNDNDTVIYLKQRPTLDRATIITTSRSCSLKRSAGASRRIRAANCGLPNNRGTALR